MKNNQALPSDLIQAYQRTEYRVLAPAGTFTLEIGAFSPELQACHAQYQVEQSAFITAFNPASEQRAARDNAAASASLVEWVDALELPLVHGESIDPDGRWPVEGGLLVLGIDRETATALAADFGQNALVYVTSEAIPELLVLTSLDK